jgi:hypothetical protein
LCIPNYKLYFTVSIYFHDLIQILQSFLLCVIVITSRVYDWVFKKKEYKASCCSFLSLPVESIHEKKECKASCCSFLWLTVHRAYTRKELQSFGCKPIQKIRINYDIFSKKQSPCKFLFVHHFEFISEGVQNEKWGVLSWGTE